MGLMMSVARGADLSGKWCILRTAGQRTLKLAQSLSDAGFEVWAPEQVTRVQVPRSSRMVEKRGAILPTFVFARADRLLDLLGVLALPVNPHPRFNLLRMHDGRVPAIDDRMLNSLRAAEERAGERAHRAARAALKRQRLHIERGTKVRMEEGVYAGLRGIVERCDGKVAVVSSPGRHDVTVPTFLLVVDGTVQLAA
jgi:transcription antitermination factor NusG